MATATGFSRVGSAGLGALAHARCKRQCHLGAPVFLQKMAGAADGGVGLAMCTGDLGLPDFFASACDRVAAAEEGQKGLFPGFEEGPGASDEDQGPCR